MNTRQRRRSKGLCVKCVAEARRNLVAEDRARRDARIWQARGREWFTYKAATHDRFCDDCYEARAQAADKREQDRLRKIDRYHKNQDKYWARKKAGLCAKCGKQEPANGYTTCDSCRARSQEWSRLKKAGLCVKCGTQPPAAGDTMCEPCRQRKRAQAPT